MSDKEASNVLTSENSAEFYAQKLDLAPVAEPSATTEVVEQAPVEEPSGSESEGSEEAKTEVTEKKPNPKLEKRFSELTKQRELARQEAQREREARESLEKRLAELETKVTPKAEPTDKEPQPSDFTDAFEYAKALAKYSTEKALENRDKQEAERRVNEERAKVMTSWQKKLDAVKSELPDYEEMIASSADIAVSDAVRDAILESDVGPKILYHLAENPEVAERLNGLSQSSALRELGKLEARFEAKEPVRAVSKSNAPAPITPLRNVGSVELPAIDSNGNFNGSPKQWRELRKAGKIR